MRDRAVQRTALSRRTLAGGLVGAAMLPRWSYAQTVEERIAGARREGRMALASSVSVSGFSRFLDAFVARYPFIDVRAGLYTAPTGRVMARVDAEARADALTFDVLHVASLAPYISYAQDGALMGYASPERAAFPASAFVGDQWTTARIVGVIMAYNSRTLPAERAPKSWTDLLAPQWKGRKIVIQDSAAGTTFNQFYIFEQEFGADFLKRLAAQDVVIVSTAAQVIDLLVRGEAMIGATVDHYRAFEPDAVRAGIIGVFPTEFMPIAAAPIAILRRAPHPNAARLFIDFTLSREGQQLLDTDIFGAYSMRGDVAPPAGQPPLSQVRPVGPRDLGAYVRAAAEFPDHFDAIFK